jgi:hypothetical protein
MKKLLFIALFGLSLSSFGQGNALSLSLSPADLGAGVRYDRYFGDVGVYLSGSYGNYAFHSYQIRDHRKASSGLTLRMANQTYVSYFSLGVCAHKYGKTILPEDYDTKRVLSLLSYEIGAGTCIGRFVAGIRIDLYKWDAVIDVGFKF